MSKEKRLKKVGIALGVVALATSTIAAAVNWNVQNPVIHLEEVAATKGVTKAKVNLLKSPDSDEILEVLPKGTKLTIVGRNGKWLKVKADDVRGWVLEEEVSLLEETEQIENTALESTEQEKPAPVEEVPEVAEEPEVVEVPEQETLPPVQEQKPEAEQVPEQVETPDYSGNVYDFSTVISTMTSYYTDSTYQRASNVELAASKINGLILEPGESYSFTALVGPVDANSGYQMATVFSGGEHVDGMGGGICQVSSTIYYAQLLAGIRATERHAHSNAVGYVPLGLDATMWEGSLDHRFTNPFDVPIQLWVTASGGVLTVQFAASYDVNQGKTYEPYTVPISTGGATETWDTYLRTYENGSVISDEYLHRSTYKMW